MIDACMLHKINSSSKRLRTRKYYTSKFWIKYVSEDINQSWDNQVQLYSNYQLAITRHDHDLFYEEEDSLILTEYVH